MPAVSDDVGRYASMILASNNFPAIAYWDATDNELWYIESDDGTGSSWGEPILVDAAGGAHVTATYKADPSRVYFSYQTAETGGQPCVDQLTGAGFDNGHPRLLVTGDVTAAYSAGAIMGNGLPIVAYYSEGRDRLEVAVPRMN